MIAMNCDYSLRICFKKVIHLITYQHKSRKWRCLMVIPIIIFNLILKFAIIVDTVADVDYEIVFSVL